MGELERLSDAMTSVAKSKRGLLGLFRDASVLKSLAHAFGEPVSWQWFVPLRTRGSEDPLAPRFHDAEACEAWASLGSALAACHKVINHRRNAADQWSERIERFLSTARDTTGARPGARLIGTRRSGAD